MTGACVATRASRIPGTPRIVPTETTGLDGGTSTRSASLIASRTPGPGLASSMPMGTTAWAGISARWRIQYSWKCTALRSPVSGSSMTTCVSTRSSVIGSSSTPGSQRRHSAAVTALSGYPASSIWVRTRWVAMSRSPRPNQLGSTPYAASSSLACQVSCRRPQPRSGSMPSPRVYITVSRSGHTLSPCTQMSSAVLATTVTEVGTR